MGRGTTVENPGDELTGNNGGGTTVHGKGDINKQIGIMGSEGPTRESIPHLTEQSEPTDDVIYIEMMPTPIPPPNKPNTASPTNP